MAIKLAKDIIKEVETREMPRNNIVTGEEFEKWLRKPNSRFVMDQTSAPYEENENLFVQTELDNKFEQMIINKHHLITKEMEFVN